MTDETNQESTPAPTEETTSHAPTPTTPWHKGMASPNPRGRPKQPKTVAEVRALAQEKTAAMIEVLGRVALNPKAPFAARVQRRHDTRPRLGQTAPVNGHQPRSQRRARNLVG